MAELPGGLLNAVKDYLDITWPDTAGDAKLTGIVARGMAYLSATAGHELDFEKEEKPRELLFDYCRYARSSALEQFQANYLSELLTLQHQTQINYYAALKSLSIGSLVITPGFAADVFEYAAETGNDSDTISVAAEQNDAVIVITNGETALNNGAAAAWAAGENVLSIAVTYGTITKTYIVTVTRE